MKKRTSGYGHADPSLGSRDEDLPALCPYLNEAGAQYVVVGGLAVRAAGYDRRTYDRRKTSAVARLPDHAAAELQPGEIRKYVVVRVADEIVVELMQSASGIDYRHAASRVSIHEIRGVQIPFASVELLLAMKTGSVRDKDRADVAFLERLVRARAE